MVSQIEQVAKVARISLNPKEIKDFGKDLEDILNAFKVIERADTKNVKPSFQPIEIRNSTRKDIVEESLTVKEALDNTKNRESGYFKGPRVV